MHACLIFNPEDGGDVPLKHQLTYGLHSTISQRWQHYSAWSNNFHVVSVKYVIPNESYSALHHHCLYLEHNSEIINPDFDVDRRIYTKLEWKYFDLRCRNCSDAIISWETLQVSSEMLVHWTNRLGYVAHDNDPGNNQQAYMELQHN
jgi:hypothetical protein